MEKLSGVNLEEESGVGASKPGSSCSTPITGRWNPATVHAESDEPRSYILRNMNGKEFRRNRQHIRESCQLPHQNVEPPENAHATPTPTRLPTASTETELPNTVVPSVPPSTPARYTTRSGRVVRNYWVCIWTLKLDWNYHIGIVRNKVAKNVSVMNRVKHVLTSSALYSL